MNNSEDATIKENNENFWLRMTKEGTLQYCHEMLKLSVEFQSKRPIDTPYEEHLKSLDKDIEKYMDFVVDQTNNKTWHLTKPEDSPFPPDIHGYIHDFSEERKFQPNHLMCKLAALRDETNKLIYEFLIEYDIFATDVEIYFGVKAVHDTWITTPVFQTTVIDNWEKVKEAGAYKHRLYKFKMTNNGNDGTYWPFWWRMGMDCKENLRDAVQDIKKFYKDYKETLHLKDIFTPKFDLIKDEVANSLRSTEDYKILMDFIREEFAEEVRDNFEILIEHCLEENIIRRINPTGLVYACVGPTTRFICLLKVFFKTMHLTFCKGKRKACYTPNKYLQKVFLDRNNRAIGNKSWDVTPASPAWYEAEKKIQRWFKNQK